jgi:hypothetical protein
MLGAGVRPATEDAVELGDIPDLVWRRAGAVRVVLCAPVDAPQKRLGVLSPLGAADGEAHRS